MAYKKFKLRFGERDKILAELDNKRVDEIKNKTDLLFDDKYSNIFCINPSMAIKNIITFNVDEYQALLRLIAKKLNLDSKKEVLRLLLERDKKTLKMTIKTCAETELEYVLAALVVYNNTICFRKKELMLLVNEEEYEDIKDVPVHHFFKVYNGAIEDERMMKYPGWYYFARLISK